MSMWLSLCRVPEEAFPELKKSPDLLEAVFFDADDEAKARVAALGITETAGADYLSLAAAHEAIAELEGEEAPEDVIEAELGEYEELAFDAGYGPAFFIRPDRVAAAVDGSMIPEMDEEAKALFAAAIKARSYIVGVVS